MWQAYSAGIRRFREFQDKPGVWITICGDDDAPIEEVKGNLDQSNSADYAVLVASQHGSFFNHYLLDDRSETYKRLNKLAVQAHPEWCTKGCDSKKPTCDRNPQLK